MASNNFMTAKEKNYVADCFKRNMKYLRSDVDYAGLFDADQAEKIEIRIGEDEPKKNSSLVFGKESKKSNRRLRPCFGIELEAVSPPLRTMFLLENLIDFYTIRRHCKLAGDDLDRNIKSFRSLLATNFNRFVSSRKFFGFLGQYLKDADEDDRKDAIVLLQKTFHLVGNTSEFYDFINSSINSISRISKEELEPGFTSTFLFFPSGIILATSLLIQNEGLGAIFYEAVIGEPSTSFMKNKYAWQFLSVLVSVVSDERQRLIVRKAKPRLIEIAEGTDAEEANQARFFLDTIGVDLEDIRK